MSLDRFVTLCVWAVLLGFSLSVYGCIYWLVTR